jgi:hypothetical protein
MCRLAWFHTGGKAKSVSVNSSFDVKFPIIHLSVKNILIVLIMIRKYLYTAMIVKNYYVLEREQRNNYIGQCGCFLKELSSKK